MKEKVPPFFNSDTTKPFHIKPSNNQTNTPRMDHFPFKTSEVVNITPEDYEKYFLEPKEKCGKIFPEENISEEGFEVRYIRGRKLHGKKVTGVSVHQLETETGEYIKMDCVDWGLEEDGMIQKTKSYLEISQFIHQDVSK